MYEEHWIFSNTYRLTVHSLEWFSIAVYASMHIGRVLAIEPEKY